MQGKFPMLRRTTAMLLRRFGTQKDPAIKYTNLSIATQTLPSDQQIDKIGEFIANEMKEEVAIIDMDKKGIATWFAYSQKAKPDNSSNDRWKHFIIGASAGSVASYLTMMLNQKDIDQKSIKDHSFRKRGND